jgi:hypothetical protein
LYEYHGWIVVSSDPYDPPLAQEAAAIKVVEEIVSSPDWPNGFIEMRHFNGKSTVVLGGLENRPGRVLGELKLVLRSIVAAAPGSYGLIYWRADEDESPPGPNEFHVLAVAKGKVLERFDPFLSPANPTIED